jgi:hypothetical protein
MSGTDQVRTEWDADGLIASAEAEGLTASPRLLRNWIDEGLLDRRLVRGRGPRRGVARGVWSENQRQLFLLLLGKRQREAVRRDSTLANIPVWLWLTRGDDHVPTTQVQRALRTWAVPARYPPGHSAAATARRVVAQLAHPDASSAARRRLREAIQRSQAGEVVAREELLAAATAALDPHGTTRDAAPPGAAPTNWLLVDHIVAVLRGLDAILTWQPSPDDLEGCREVYRSHRPADAWLAPRACLDLVTILGHELGRSSWRDRRPTGRRTTASRRRQEAAIPSHPSSLEGPRDR